jgi:hypothetical protein
MQKLISLATALVALDVAGATPSRCIHSIRR